MNRLPRYLLLSLCALAGFLGLFYSLPRWLYPEAFGDRAVNAHHLRRTVDLLCLIPTYGFAFYYGWCRSVLTLPQLDPNYQEWLARSPWTASQPLPRGPVGLRWYEWPLLISLGLLAGYLHAGDLDRYDANTGLTGIAGVVIAFFGSSCLGLGCAVGRHPGHLIAPLLLIPLGLRCQTLWQGALLVLLIYALLLRAWFRVMRQFPWNTPFWTRTFENSWLKSARSQRLVHPCHPMLELHTPEESVTGRQALGISLAVAWVYWCMWPPLNAMSVAEGIDINLVCLAVAAPVACLRWLVYFIGSGPIWPPLTLVGRLATRKLIIPAYDIVFVGPILTVLVGVVWFYLTRLTRLPQPWSGGSLVAVIIFTACAAGPRRRHWQLTAPCRLHRPSEPVYRDWKQIEITLGRSN